MTWNYRIVEEPKGWFSIRSIYYQDDEAMGYSADPESFTGESPEEILEAIQRFLKSHEAHGVFVPEPEADEPTKE